MTGSHSLLVADDCVLVVIDVQDSFLKKLPQAESESLVDKIRWLVGVAQWRNIPLMVTAEERDSDPLADSLQQALPPNTYVFDKLTFGLAADPAILAAVQKTNRQTIVLVGLETDVCVTQSALGLLDLGYRVVVVADAVGSPQNGQAIGLERMRAAGVVTVSVKSLYYEWIRTVANAYRFRAERPDLERPKGIVF